MEIEMATRMVRLSATVPKHIIDETDEMATAKKISRSQLISECLTEMIQRRKEELLAEGYRAMARQHEEFVLLTQNAAKEVLPNW
jgi:metal-responsive CopG/Arc/MetJ family transcriptional regulator